MSALACWMVTPRCSSMSARYCGSSYLEEEEEEEVEEEEARWWRGGVAGDRRL